MIPEVVQRIADYAPRGVETAKWEAVAALVRCRVAASKPASGEMALRLLSAGTYLAIWAFDQQIPFEDRTVFSDETIERYISQLDRPDKTRATVRGRLRRLMPHRPEDQIPSISPSAVRPPYTPDELMGLWRLAGAQPTELRRWRLRALICCAAGAGCQSSDLRHVYTTSVVDDPEGPTWLEIGGDRTRRVPVLAGFDIALVEAASHLDGLLVGDSPGQRSLVWRLTDSIVGGEDLPRLNVSRLRSTWLVCLLNAWVPASTLLELAGTRTMRVLQELLPYTDLYDQPAQDRVVDAVRNAWRPEWL